MIRWDSLDNYNLNVWKYLSLVFAREWYHLCLNARWVSPPSTTSRAPTPRQISSHPTEASQACQNVKIGTIDLAYIGKKPAPSTAKCANIKPIFFPYLIVVGASFLAKYLRSMVTILTCSQDLAWLELNVKTSGRDASARDVVDLDVADLYEGRHKILLGREKMSWL